MTTAMAGNDGRPGSSETNAREANSLNAASVPERTDTAGDDDGDGSTTSASSGAEVYDCDGDGFTGTVELALVTIHRTSCGNNGWPADPTGSDNS
jgi:hypothetical protein